MSATLILNLVRSSSLNPEGVGSHPRWNWGYSRLSRHSDICHRLVWVACRFRQVSFLVHSNNSADHSPIPRSSRRGILPALNRWFWVSHICARDVRLPRLRHRKHSAGGGCNCDWCPGVRTTVFFTPPINCPNLKTFSPILFWKFGERVRNASTYSVKTPPPMR